MEERRKDFFFGLSLGWDALAHERYALLSSAASVSAYALRGYVQENGRKAVALQPEQRKAIAACAEVAGIPFDPEATEIAIPESAFNHTERLLEEALRSTGRSRAPKALPPDRREK